MNKKRPEWCKHKDCKVSWYSKSGSPLCTGHLPKPTEHNGDYNIYRICFHDESTYDFMINDTDIYWIKIMFDKLQNIKSVLDIKKKYGSYPELSKNDDRA